MNLESRDSLEHVLAGKAHQAALALISERFEGQEVENRLAFHNRAHTIGVYRRALRIASAITVTPRDRLLIGIAASFHDVVQEWEPLEKEGGTVVRKRHAVSNEEQSAEEAIAWMRESGFPFTDEDYQKVRTAIMATVPSWDADLKTVAQKDLTAGADVVTRAVTLADLGAAGMEPDVSTLEGVSIFAEEQLDIADAIRGGIHRIPAQIQAAYKERFVTYLASQVEFIKGRKARLSAELSGLPPDKQERVQSLFEHFDESIRIAENNVTKAKAMDFASIARWLHPEAVR